MGRAPCCDKATVKRGPWSPEEDDILRNYIQRCGTGGNWISLPAKAGLKRCGKSCRLRWLNYLRPDIKHGGFTEEEDSIICTLYYHIGSRWSVIASKLPGRTDNDVKNYWNTKLKKKLLTQMTSLKTVVVPNNFEHQNQLQSSASIDSQLSNGGQFDQGASAPESRSPFQSLLDVSDYSCASSVPEVSTLSSVESSVVMGSDSSWPANGSSAEEETTLDFDFESVHDVISGFDFQQGIS